VHDWLLQQRVVREPVMVLFRGRSHPLGPAGGDAQASSKGNRRLRGPEPFESNLRAISWKYAGGRGVLFLRENSSPLIVAYRVALQLTASSTKRGAIRSPNSGHASLQASAARC
jgi:hypothetical protein